MKLALGCRVMSNKTGKIGHIVQGPWEDDDGKRWVGVKIDHDPYLEMWPVANCSPVATIPEGGRR